MRAWRIRQATKDDAEAMARLHHETVHTVNVRDYSAAQVHAWAPARLSAEDMRCRQHGKLVWVAEDGDRLIGFIELDRDGHMACLYSHKDYQRCGVGTQLLASLTAHAEQAGLGRLYAEVSITARPFFERYGFCVVREQQVERHGVRLTNFVMERLLVES